MEKLMRLFSDSIVFHVRA